MSEPVRVKLTLLDRYLTLWIFLAMGVGVALGFLAPSFTTALDSMSVGTTSMMMPVEMNCVIALPAKSRTVTGMSEPI